MKVNTTQIIEAIFGAILIFYLIGSVWNDASAQLTNTTGTGSVIIRLLGLFLAFGVVYAMFKMFMNK